MAWCLETSELHWCDTRVGSWDRKLGMLLPWASSCAVLEIAVAPWTEDSEVK